MQDWGQLGASASPGFHAGLQLRQGPGKAQAADGLRYSHIHHTHLDSTYVLPDHAGGVNMCSLGDQEGGVVPLAFSSGQADQKQGPGVAWLPGTRSPSCVLTARLHLWRSQVLGLPLPRAGGHLACSRHHVAVGINKCPSGCKEPVERCPVATCSCQAGSESQTQPLSSPRVPPVACSQLPPRLPHGLGDLRGNLQWSLTLSPLLLP